MKKLMWVVGMFFVISLLTISLFSDSALAQGTCTCSSTGGSCTADLPSGCEAGYSPVCRDAGGVCKCRCDLIGGSKPGAIHFTNLEEITLNSSLAGQKLSAPIQQALPYVFAVAGTALLVFIIYSGYRMMLSRGDPKAMAAGRQALMYGILGIVIIFVAYWIVVVVGAFFGITPFNDVFIDR